MGVGCEGGMFERQGEILALGSGESPKPGVCLEEGTGGGDWVEGCDWEAGALRRVFQGGRRNVWIFPMTSQHWNRSY